MSQAVIKLSFDVAEDVASFLRCHAADLEEAWEGCKDPSSGMIFEEDISIESDVVQAFCRSLICGEEIYFINLFPEDRRSEQDVSFDDFRLSFDRDCFGEVFGRATFAARRIIWARSTSYMLASFGDWGLLARKADVQT